jgi:hypothetical protein
MYDVSFAHNHEFFVTKPNSSSPSASPLQATHSKGRGVRNDMCHLICVPAHAIVGGILGGA